LTPIVGFKGMTVDWTPIEGCTAKAPTIMLAKRRQRTKGDMVGWRRVF
jgi:hypothetical protein